MFEFLFKYPLEQFSRGELILALPWWQFALLPLALLALVFTLLGYFGLRGRSQLRDRVAIALSRSLALALLLFSLSRPLLEVSAPLAQPNLVGILLDNSLSMSIADHDGVARGEFIRRQLDRNSGELLRSLQQRFETRLFKFGASTQPLDDVGALDFAEADSDLAGALAQLQLALKGEPLAGLVVIGDAARATSGALEKTLLSLRAAQIPLYTVGVGQSRYARDIEISRVSLPRRALSGSRVVAEVTITQQGYDGQTVELVVEDDSRILHKQPLRLQPGRQLVRVELSADEAGARQLGFSLAQQAGEQIDANNIQQEILSVNDDKMRILYFEGEPRFELKFVRRAVADDDNLAVTGLIRTADAKYYRVGIASQKELRDGFPITRDELFGYDALILGSVESSLLSPEQQQMIIDFVSLRGGSLLLLGGRHAFAEGGYRDSPLRDLMPVVMADRAQPGFRREISLQPTEAAWVHPALSLAENGEASMARWLSLPALTIVNPIHEIKPGATLLLQSRPSAQQQPYVAMAFQRYGRGKVVAFPVQNSWIWQMHHEIEPEDQSHELLWRHLLRWLVEEVPPRLGLSLSTHRIHAGGSIMLRAEVRPGDVSADAKRLRAVLTAATGVEETRPMSRHASLPGVYQAEIGAVDVGAYRLRVEFDEQEETVSSAESRFIVTPGGDEFYQSQMNDSLLRRMASETNGAYFAAADSHKLADAMGRQQSRAATLVRHQLWDMPAIFMLLVLLLCAEWGYRRWRRLV